ncbi:PREDICTED: leucine-rich repeat-containing G-protein coupled receptor 4 isoform X1 [Rhagoletis zephyria]|uniref:leucine-rich repeat-containing G-protein coupled receptor 4 isoform X1 n=1 Tax=Rhagoletis zephyria TaxID=28612 RepID=UPI0008113F92|nr:PREDICTED: leucine-rich repeat-containing G-protein coupled receptor 4 isoform X1 [Rhagoletis zephyria]
MAISRGRGNRTHSWFLLKDSVIFVLVMCALQLLQAHALSKLVINAEMLRANASGGADQRRPTTNAASSSNALNAVERGVKQLMEKIFLSENLVEQTKEAVEKLATVGSKQASASNSISNSINRSSGRSSSNNNNTSNHNYSISNSSNTSNTSSVPQTGSNKTFTPISAKPNDKSPAANESVTNDVSSTNTQNSTQFIKAFGAQPPAQVDASNPSASGNATASVTGGSHQTKRIAITMPEHIRENVVLSSLDPEKEAQLLYEQTLLEYHGSVQAAAASNDNPTAASTDKPALLGSERATPLAGASADRLPRTLHAVCEVWTQKHCHCTGTLERLALSCRGIGIVAVPVELPDDVVSLTLSDNSIINIDPNAFYGLGKLKRLNLQNCGLKSLPAHAFQGLKNLISLQLNGNALASMDTDSLQHLPKLRTLRLEGNLFYRIPANALAGLKALEALNLGSNLLTIINDDDFPRMPNLVVLLLKRNQIMKISANAFANLTALKVLELDDNLINSLPEGLNKLTHLQELSVTSNRLRWINETDLPRNLQTLDFRANPLSLIMPRALRGMARLRKLILSDVRALKVFPDLEGCFSLEIIKLDRAGIKEVPSNLCRQTPRLKSLELKTNSLVRIPNLANCRELRLLDLSSNHIESLGGRPFVGLKQLHDLVLSYNRIKAIPQDAFFGIPRLQLLDLEGNEIASIHKEAFMPFAKLEDLNLGNNIFPELPSAGLNKLLHLKTFNNPKLREFPAPDTFPRIQTLILSYAYHCCPFIPLVAMSATKKPPLVQEAVLFPSDSEFDMSLWNNSMMDIWPQLQNLSKKFGNQMHDIWDNFGQDFNYPGNTPTYVEEYFEEENTGTTTTATGMASSFAGFSTGLFGTVDTEIAPGSIQCLPMPGPFLPCADLFDWWTLRCGVWVVFLLALLGNGTVVIVLMFSRSKMDVPRFLVCNLAAADFFMGIYLGILAIVDASTLGEFRMFAIPWQMSLMCQFAGFLAVLSSELSVYTLAVITLERNYAITHAIHLNKRLSLRQSAYIMAVGWTFALIMAALPLAGISDYRKFAVCLPFETTTGVASLTYVIALMFINGCAFVTLMGCYLKMYWAIRGSQAWNTNDSRIAKRMALLVFTDFLCWSPIAFFSITAIFGLQLISLEQAKIFTVFVLPLNSCCNPFLYAIMTKQFKKDCITLCKHFEEARVTRGAGAAAATALPGGLGRRGGVRVAKELPPLLPAAHPPGCRCLRMMPNEMPNWHKLQERERVRNTWASSTWHWLAICCHCADPDDDDDDDVEARHLGGGRRQRKSHKASNRHTRTRSHNAATDPYLYQFAELKQKQKQTRASSISSENFCSSRSSSWRNGPPSAGAVPHTCNVPLKMMDPNRRRHSAWLITRKTSQDSNLSSSRNDSSASATTASTSTFRLSRSSAGSTTPLPSIMAHSSKAQQQQLQQHSTLPSKPRLVRQEAVQEEEDSSPPRLGVRFLPTIPSAADSSIIMEDGDSAMNVASVMGMPLPGAASGFYTVLQAQSGGAAKTLLTSTTSPQFDTPKEEHPP